MMSLAAFAQDCAEQRFPANSVSSLQADVWAASKIEGPTL
jgi:hypothetical protein